MSKRFISGLLFMAILVMVVHNAIPHHHHDGVVMHCHDSHHDSRDPGSADDHHTRQCIIQSTDFNVPRVHSAGKNLSTPSSPDHAGLPVLADPIPAAAFNISGIPAATAGPPSRGVSPAAPSRGPPPVFVA